MKNRLDRDYCYMGIHVEMTRRCNLKCAHCARGPMQEVSITREIIDRLLRNVIYCDNLYLTGGEPLLEPELMLYLIRRITDNPTTFVRHLSFTSNGTVTDAGVIDALEAFCLSNRLHSASISISDDQFHSGKHDSAFEFYSELANQANARLRKAHNVTDEDVEFILIASQDLGNRTLIYSGNAVKLYEEQPDKYQIGKNLQTVQSYNHRMKITDPGMVHCTVYITCRGDVVAPMEDDSFENYDRNAIGNIMDNSLRYIIDRHQDQCLLLCDESGLIDLGAAMQMEAKDGTAFEKKLDAIFVAELTNAILRVRQSLKAQHPFLAAQDVIEAIPMPRAYSEAAIYLTKLAEVCPYYGGGLLSQLEKLYGKELTGEFGMYLKTPDGQVSQHIAQCMMALAFLKTEDGQRYLRGLIEHKEMALGLKIKLGAMRCIQNNGKPDNSKVFPCAQEGIFQKYDRASAYELLDMIYSNEKGETT